MRPNAYAVHPFSYVDELEGIMSVPKGDLATFGVNPFNGNIVFCFQDNPAARFFIRLILDQLASSPNLFEDEECDPPAFYGVDAFERGRFDARRTV